MPTTYAHYTFGGKVLNGLNDELREDIKKNIELFHIGLHGPEVKLTKQESSWILYDVGNSAFILLISTIIPIYFKNIALMDGVTPANSTAYWGYAMSTSTLIVAILGPCSI